MEEVAGRSRPARRPPAGRRCSMCRSSRCQPRGRITIGGPGDGGVKRVVPCPPARCSSMVSRDGVVEVDLAGDHVVPVRGVGVLQVGEPHRGAGVERVDRHLALGRTGDLDAAVAQRRGRGRDPPVRLTDLDGLRQEAEPASLCAALQQVVAPGRVLSMQRGHELECVPGEDPLVGFPENPHLDSPFSLCCVDYRYRLRDGVDPRVRGVEDPHPGVQVAVSRAGRPRRRRARTARGRPRPRRGRRASPARPARAAPGRRCHPWPCRPAW